MSPASGPPLRSSFSGADAQAASSGGHHTSRTQPTRGQGRRWGLHVGPTWSLKEAGPCHHAPRAPYTHATRAPPGTLLQPCAFTPGTRDPRSLIHHAPHRPPPVALCVHPRSPHSLRAPLDTRGPGRVGRLPGWAMEAGTQPRQPHTWAQQRLNAALPGALPGLKPVSRCWPRPVSRAAAPLCAVWCCARARLRAPAAAPTGPTLSLPPVPRCPCGAGLCAARGARCSPRWTALLETLPSPLAPTHAVPWSQLTDVLEPSGTDLERGTLCPHRSCDRHLDECRPPAPPPRPRPCPAYPACLPEQDVHVFFLLDSRF